jgi:acyl-CoA reductase-like NAD-dependent aldehyde dehydrogenase
MANVFNRVAPEYLISVNTPNFDVADWAINPDVSGVAGNPVKYWFLDGTTNPQGFEVVGIVDAAAQAAIDAAILAAQVTANKESEKLEFDQRRVLKAFAELVKNQFNTLRALHGLPNLTTAQLRTTLRDEIDSGP